MASPWDSQQGKLRELASKTKAEAPAQQGQSGRENAVLAAIAEMKEPDRAMAKRLHALIKASAPDLPQSVVRNAAYAKNDKVVCFFQPAQKFKTRDSTFGFNDTANLDDGTMWSVAYALKELTAADEKKIAALVKKAAS